MEADGYRTVYHSATGGEPAVVQEGAEQQEAPENPYKPCLWCRDGKSSLCMAYDPPCRHAIWQAGFEAGRRAI